MIQKIKQLKQEKDFVILAHYYVDGSVQGIADYVGDSFYLSKTVTGINSRNILFAGVSFMGESAKLLNPEKHVYMADDTADCPMAHMVEADEIHRIREENEDLAVVCYVNSTAEIKALSDVCVTSSNALKVVSNLKEKNIFFIPDYNLGHYIAGQMPEKNFILNDGFCHVHKSIEDKLVKQAKEMHPAALILAHPECTEDVLDLADFIGSTSQIIDFATGSKETEFIICTEMGIFYELSNKNQDKRFYSVGHRQFCPNMKKINMQNILSVLKNPANEIILPDELMEKARIPLIKMLELAK